jgi:hypothetical protein
MAEALAMVGFVAAIVQFIDFSSKIVKCLDEFQSSIDDVPRSFRDIKNELPLLLDTPKRTKEQAEAGYVDNGTQQALLPVVKRLSFTNRTSQRYAAENAPYNRRFFMGTKGEGIPKCRSREEGRADNDDSSVPLETEILA